MGKIIEMVSERLSLFNLSHKAIEGNAITLDAVIAGHQKTFSASLLP